MVTPLEGRKAVIAKLGMDAHWRGAIVIANALRDAGMEVVYLGHVTPAELAVVVVQEDPILIGLSALSGNHLTEVPAVLDALASHGVGDIAVVVGGAIPDPDAASLLERGVAGVFPTGSALGPLLDGLARIVSEREARGSLADELPR